jgi:PTH2 family peptidyl-tRNA hydrolase
MSDMDVKQVIVIRKDLKMRRGKEIAQGAHASISFLVEALLALFSNNGHAVDEMGKDPAVLDWMRNGMKKITLQVDSERELMELSFRAQRAGLRTSLIRDAGHTEFDGRPTYTALAIGPDVSEDIDELTSELKLY